MNIRYHTRKLEKSVESFSAIKKNYGDRAKKVALRLEQLSQAPDLDAMGTLSTAHCHELKAERVGEIAVDISPNHRLIFFPDHNPLPLKTDGGLAWKQVTSIVITAIGEDYH
jgi:plasmid maintenance system killer protein